jgi:SAM-dependent methyltransferase
MPSIEENQRLWGGSYDWANRGEEWSEVWGGSQAQWASSILPRIRAFLPARRALEIGCGHGRWSRLLRPHCRKLILIDLVEGCVGACRDLFKDDRAVSCQATDGRTFPDVAPGSLDFVFSFDSLVHAERDALEAYLVALASALTGDGVAFLHHSNFGAVLADRPGLENRGWRAESVSAAAIAEAAMNATLVCPLQEIVDWGDVADSDAFTLVARPGSRWDRPPVRLVNRFFMGEAQSAAIRSRLWGTGAPAPRKGFWARFTSPHRNPRKSPKA